MMRGRSNLIAALSALWLVQNAAAAIEVQSHRLDNGMKVMLYPNHQAPVVACRLFFTTGSVHEEPGETGIAHMLEHALFKGTRKVGVTDSVADEKFMGQIRQVRDKMRKVDSTDSERYQELKRHYDSLLTEHRKYFVKDELWETYLKAGGTGLNAFTSKLITAYFVTLPKNKLELFMWLEADRMQHAVLREFYPERDVVMEERRMRVEDRPTGRYWESLSGIFYEAHPFRFPTIGYASDIANYTREMAEEHYRKYYKPNNAILVLAGAFDPDSAMSLVRSYFGPIPPGEELDPVVTAEPLQPGQKRLIVHEKDATPRFDMMFHTPGMPDEDLFALDIVEGVLSGKSGRLHRKLISELKIATSATAANGIDKYTSSFDIHVEMGGDPKPEQVEDAVWAILEDLQEDTITTRELQRVKNQVVARSLRSLKNMEHLATELAFWELYGGWELINQFPKKVQEVTPEQVREVCRRYFERDRATVGLILPPREAARKSTRDARKPAEKGGRS